MSSDKSIIDEFKTIEELLGRDDTLNLKDEFKTSIKINKYGGKEDSDAWMMIALLKKKNISISAHIRMLLALEYKRELMLPGEYAIHNSASIEQYKEYSYMNNFNLTAQSDKVNELAVESENTVVEHCECGDDSDFD